MKILINTDKTINGDERHHHYFSDLIANKLEIYKTHITRIEAHITDQNGNKNGANDIHCLLEARLEGMPSVVVSHQADTIEHAVLGAIENMKSALKKSLGRELDEGRRQVIEERS